MGAGRISVEEVHHRLVEAGCLSADEEEEELVAATRDDLTLEQRIRRRERGEPLAWILGRTVFCGQELHVVPGVYVPRAQSEILVRRAEAVLGSGRAADLCTGCGAVARALEAASPGAEVVGVDIDPVAAGCARRNGVSVVVADLAQALASRSFEAVTAVAPYVPTPELGLLPRDVLRYEPRIALDGGEDGLDLVRRIVRCARRLLVPGGWLLLELGGRQDLMLDSDLMKADFHDVDTWADEDGDLRGLMAQFG